MQRNVLLVMLFTVSVSGDGLAQGHPDSSAGAPLNNDSSMEIDQDIDEHVRVLPVTSKFHDSRCEAKLLIEYYQKGTDAHVNSELTNDVCGASFGDYTIRVRYKDAHGEIKQLEFEETWAREDDAEWTSEKEYFVGDDIDIIRVKAKDLSCKCKEPEA